MALADDEDAFTRRLDTIDEALMTTTEKSILAKLRGAIYPAKELRKEVGVDDRVVREDVEILMGHRCSYHRPSFERLEAVYVALQPLLSFKPSGRPRENSDLPEGTASLIRELRLRLAKQGREVVALNIKLDGLVSMVERLVSATPKAVSPVSE